MSDAVLRHDDSAARGIAAAAMDDQGLCAVVRHGADTEDGRAAFAELYERHRDTVMAQAYSMTGDRAVAEDLVAETFARVLRALSNGNGPQESVLGYLLISLRSEAIRTCQAEAGTVQVEPSILAEMIDEQEPDFSDALSERDQIGRAFARIPEDARRVLWLLDVEQTTIEAAAEHLGMSAGAVRVLAHRSRKKLATAYLQQYVEASDPACTEIAVLLAEHVRGELGKRGAGRVEAHLPNCVHCTGQVRRLASLQGQLRAWGAPLLAGGTVTGFVLGGDAPAAVAAPQRPSEAGASSGNGAKAAAWIGLAAGVALLIAGAFALFPRDATGTPDTPRTMEAGAPVGERTAPSPVDREALPAEDGGTEAETVDHTPREEEPADTPVLPEGGPDVPVDDTTPNWKLRNE
ncbi:sigma-70 family RNA polymerase sigma factor [Leucobacter celer]|uniref:sigma-70 family RNA polymerase sigma factor n=1 Tax=Leucobacter celer TaxID=668625 RepID=UPI00138F0542|nr:sigma-70 family RNA polymerase sigma factor [Leucobacter celer]